MSSITPLDKDGKPIKRGDKQRAVKFRVRYRTPDGDSRSKTFDRMRAAEQFASGVEVKKATGQFVDPMAGKTMFKAYAETWLDRKRAVRRPGTVQMWASHLNKHLYPAFGDRALASITRSEVKSFALSLQGGELAPTTVRAIIFTMAAVLREAVDDQLLFGNVAERLSFGDRADRRVDPLHVGAVSGKVPAIADAMPERWRAAVLLMASIGLRLGECLGLTVDRVDFLRRTIRIDRQLTNTAGQSGFGPTKTRAGVRTIPVPADVVEMLASHLAMFAAGDDGLIFTMRAGRPVNRSSWTDEYNKACASAGLLGQTRTHDLRHVAASSLINGGLSVAAVQAVLGHSTAAETLEVYTHLWPTDEERTRDAIERVSSPWLRAAN